ncbi:MAG TPA: RluA family pseudouridine synthase [Oligoflexia bacterium]|mgnify:CR=1 FL=1|nr:RluA family pseudouridine synthase [Oligoflexia bacterium]HMP47725.1 RluA family pseudouridine synthase [Oligoflexia bacterium]
MRIIATVPELLKGEKLRLDIFILDQIKKSDPLNASRSIVQEAIKCGMCTVNRKTEKKCGAILRGNEVVSCTILLPVSGLVPDSSVQFDTLFEDHNLLVINKPPGLVVHPARGVRGSTLVHGILHRLSNESSLEMDNDRPGIVHRLDKDTSGVMVVAKNNFTKRFLQNQLQAPRTMKRVYNAICLGLPEQQNGTEIYFDINRDCIVGKLDTYIARNVNNRIRFSVSNDLNSRNAITHFRVINAKKTVSLIEFRLETGRTHQIRVHAEYMKCPIIGDSVYGPSKSVLQKLPDHLVKNLPCRQMLHARFLSFIEPESSKEVSFTAPYPEDFIKTAGLLDICLD